jgi:hypothetical protein
VRRVWRIPTFLALLALGAVTPGSAQEGAGQGEAQAPDSLVHPGEALEVLLVTLGQGDAVWERFGHNALWIRNRETGQGAAFNWGIFSFFQEGFIYRLAQGTMLYMMAPMDGYAMVDEARRLGRRIWIQELALTPDQKMDLLAFAQWNAAPENAYYRYDYYRDNCSTRVRDALDRVLDGRLAETSQDVTTPYTFRWHTRRLLRDRPAPYLGIQFVLGPGADRPISVWEEMFLPVSLMEWVRSVEVPDGEGGSRPLVLREQSFLESQRPPAPSETPQAIHWFLLAALLWGGPLTALARRGEGGSWLRRLPVAVLGGGWVLVAAISGTLLLAAWAFTDHFFWYRNMNLLQVSPLFLPLPVAFLIYLVRGSFPRWGRDMIASLAVISLVGWLMELVPVLAQKNGEILAFTIPMNLLLWLTVTWLYKDPTPPVGAPSSPEKRASNPG